MIRRAPLRRRTRLAADPAKQREWERRSRRRQVEQSRAQRIHNLDAERRRGETLLAESREYIKIRSKLMCEANVAGVCPPHPHHGRDAHHMRMRSQGGEDTHDNLIWICRPSHRWIHDHPRDARELGLLRSAWL